jgi:regulator of sigma E protease
VVVPGKPADGKLVAGDRIVSIDREPVSIFPEVQRLVAKRAGTSLRLVVLRDGKNVDVDVTPADEIELRELDIVEHVGRIGIVPSFPAPIIGVPRVDSPAYRAGLRTFDRITAVNGKKVDKLLDLETLLASNRGDTVVVAFMRPIPVPEAAGGLCDISVMEPGVATLTPSARLEAGPEGDSDTRAKDVLLRVGIESANMYVSFVPEGSSEWKAGLRSGDRITALDGVMQRHWQSMEDDLVRGANRRRELRWTRAGEPMAGVFQLRKEQWDDEFAQHYERYVFRTTNWAPNAPDAWVPNPSLVTYAIRRGFEETTSVIKFIAVGFVRILQGRVSLSSVSGPITIYDVAGQAGAKGTTYFVWAMAVISINLGLINLLPIPVLDGGHLVFLALEALKKRPLSLRAREVSSLVGMSMLFVLMLVAFKNDVERRWDVILGQIKEIFG